MGSHRAGGDDVRRVLAAAILAAGLLAGGAGTAVAVPAPPPSPPGQSLLERAGDAVSGVVGGAASAVVGDRCKIVPTVARPTDGLAGWIDPGPSTPGTGMYSTFGWGGWAPVVHDPGCPIGFDMVNGVQKRTFDGANSVAKGLTDLSLVESALAVQISHVVLDPSGAWSILTPFTEFVRYTLGYRTWWLLGALALAATGTYFLVRARHGEVGEDGKASFAAGLILAAGAAFLVLPVTVGPTLSQGLSTFYASMSAQTAATTGQNGASADAAIGDLFAEQMLYPTWVAHHFGDNKAAADKYGMRLFYAGAMTRVEAQRAATDPGYEAALVASKRADYLAVSNAYKAEFPATYERALAGVDTSNRPGVALLGVLGTTPAAGFLLWTLWWIGAARLAVELVVAVAPAGSIITQFPRAQWAARSALAWAFEFVVTALIATVVYVAVVVGLIGGVLAGSGPLVAKIGIMLALAILARAAWKRRDRWLYRRTGDEVAKETRGILRQILDELRQRNSASSAASAGAGAVAGGAASADMDLTDAPSVDAESAPVVDDDADDKRGLDPDDQAVQPEPEETAPIVTVDEDERRLPDPVDASGTEWGPVVNPAPTIDADELRFAAMEADELERRSAVIVTAAPASKEESNVYVAAR